MIIDLDVTNLSGLLRTALNECSNCIVIASDTGIIKTVNKKMCKVSGYDENELTGADIEIFTHRHYPENSLSNLAGKIPLDCRAKSLICVRLKSGEPLLQKVKMIPYKNNSDPENYSIFCFYNNRTKLFKDSSTENNSKSLISLGKMAAYLSHEIKTPLTSIKMNADMIIRDPALPVNRIRSMQIIKDEISRLEDLSKDVLYFARSTRNYNCNFKLYDLVEELFSMLSAQLSERNISAQNLTGQESTICGDRQSIRCMLLHLINNSIESIKQDGKIELWNDNAGVDNFLAVYLRDSGEGIKNSENIFELFFTSKSNGTGLGLSIAQKIVEDHNGSIVLISPERGNTIFKINLPQSAP